MRSKARTYFYDRDGKTELTDNDFNGREWTFGGAGVDVNGEMADTTTAPVWRDAKGRIARKEVGVRIGGKEVTVRASDFGVTAVLVKEWWPGNVQWFWLVDDDAAAKIGERANR